MVGPLPSRAVRRWLLPMAALCLLSMTGSGHAQDEAQIGPAPLPAAAQESAPQPVFSPAPEAAPAPLAEPAPAPAPDATPLGEGVASYYASHFHGRRTASGESFDNQALTAAHRTLPFGSRVRVTNPRTGQSVVVRINDRGPFTRGRTIDLSRAAAEQVGIVRAGHGTVELALLAS